MRSQRVFYLAVLCLSISLARADDPALRVEDGRIVDAGGHPVVLKGFNWFGFNSGGTMVDGLWSGPALSTDFATVVQRQMLLGFNAVRLPFSFKDLRNPPRSLRTDGGAAATPEEVARSVTPPGATPPGPAPPLPAPPPTQPDKCNDYVAGNSTLDRFAWVAEFYAKNGFYVLIDNHLREDQSVLEDPARWAADWAALVTRLLSQPALRGRLMVDVLNEPDNFGIKWEAAAGKPALADLYISAMDGIEASSPGAVLFFVEGTGQGGLHANWGDGFATDPEVIASDNLSDPRPFFNALLDKPYLHRVVLSPHIYPPSVTSAPDSSGPALYNRLSTSFGTKAKDGYCAVANGDCQRFAVAVGEMGSRFADPTDLVCLQDLAAYFNNEGAANDGRHVPVENWFYWAWNANSGDTGGLVDDGWENILWQKMDYLRSIGLRPWYAGGQVRVP